MDNLLKSLLNSRVAEEKQAGEDIQSKWLACDFKDEEKCKELVGLLCASSHLFSLPALRLVASKLNLDTTGTKAALCTRIDNLQATLSAPEELDKLSHGTKTELFKLPVVMLLDPKTKAWMWKPFTASDGVTYDLSTLRAWKATQTTPLNLELPVYFNHVLYDFTRFVAEKFYNILLPAYNGPNHIYIDNDPEPAVMYPPLKNLLPVELPPDMLLDPVSLDWMPVPVIASDGVTYDLSTLQAWRIRKGVREAPLDLALPVYFNHTVYDVSRVAVEKLYGIQLPAYNGPNAIYVRFRGNTPEALRVAAGNGDLPEVNRLLLAGVNDNTQVESDLSPDEVSFGSDALHAAAENGHLQVVEALLHAGARDDNARALLAAAHDLHLDVVRVLLEKFSMSMSIDRYAEEIPTFYTDDHHLPVLKTYLDTLTRLGDRGEALSELAELSFEVAAANNELATVKWLLAIIGKMLSESDYDVALKAAIEYGNVAMERLLRKAVVKYKPRVKRRRVNGTE